ncbi:MULTISPECIES: hypothetical protein [Tsukamurella]|uniref:Site-specific integrase n=2 Tax=Tsukamurella TaxID=2060 RepID=A0A5C5RSE2_9ACTN|nr:MULTISPECIES: hypothetical protein [Tsukamurella]NMD56997.1 hypothetical protein [Tsukamurella columbiensis]TWS25694.1 hypothetical protein FK530_22475 [Tsukamurella conjunctivitidis]
MARFSGHHRSAKTLVASVAATPPAASVVTELPVPPEPVRELGAHPPEPQVSAMWLGAPESWVPEGQEALFDRLATLGVRGRSKRKVDAAARYSAALQTRLPVRARPTVETAAREVSRYLVDHVDDRGTLNLSVALRRSNVDQYLEDRRRRGRDKGMHQVKYQLYAVGRLVHPREFPPANQPISPRPRRHRPAGDHVIADHYGTAARLEGELQVRLYLLLDLCLGVGARPSDFKVLRGVDVTAGRRGGRDYAVVSLPNHSGGRRSVPIADRAASKRLLTRAEQVGDASLFRPGMAQAERNMTNRINEDLRANKLRPLDLYALRMRWLTDLAETVPAALWLQLADVSTLTALRDVTSDLPTYGMYSILDYVAGVRAA